MTRHVGVVGAGAIGLLSALALVEQGCRVTLIDPNGPVYGASLCNAGFIVPSYAHPMSYPGGLASNVMKMLDPQSTVGMKLSCHPRFLRFLFHHLKTYSTSSYTRSLHVLHTLSELSGDLFQSILSHYSLDSVLHQSGRIASYRHQRHFESGCIQAQKLESLGVSHKVLSKSDVLMQTHGSFRGEFVAGGLWFPQDHHMDPGAFLAELYSRLVKKGVRLLRTDATHFEGDSGSIRVIQTSHGPVECDAVVIAAGAYSSGLVQSLNLRLPLVPASGYSIDFEGVDPLFDESLMLMDDHITVSPFEGKTRVASTMILGDGDERHSQRDLDRIEILFKRYFTLEWFDRSRIKKSVHKGFRPCTPDSIPFIGPHPRFSNLVVAAGHGTLGYFLAPITGRIVASLITSSPLPCSLDLVHQMRLERF